MLSQTNFDPSIYTSACLPKEFLQWLGIISQIELLHQN